MISLTYLFLIMGKTSRNNFESKVFLNEVRAFAQGRQQGDELRWIIVFFFLPESTFHLSVSKGFYMSHHGLTYANVSPLYMWLRREREREGVMILDWIFLPAGQNKFFCFCWIKSKLHIAKSCFMFYYFVMLYLTLLYLSVYTYRCLFSAYLLGHSEIYCLILKNPAQHT